MQVIRNAGQYFAGVFALGFVLGTVRTLWLAPALGPLAAVAVELPLMLLASAWLCARILRRAPLSARAALGMGALALAWLLVAEAALSYLLAGRNLWQHLALYSEPAHLLGLAGQVVFALLPWVLQTAKK